MQTRLVLLALLVLLAPATAGAEPRSYGTVTVDRVVSVYDGDTFRADIRALAPIIGENIGVRVAGIDTPELKDRRPNIRARARRARAFTKATLEGATTIRLLRIRRGKYFRLVADVEVDGVDLAELLRAEKLGKRYTGRGPKPY